MNCLKHNAHTTAHTLMLVKLRTFPATHRDTGVIMHLGHTFLPPLLSICQDEKEKKTHERKNMKKTNPLL